MSLSRLSVKNGKIVNSSGKEVKLKGVNLGGWLMMEGYIFGGRNIPQSEFMRRLTKKASPKAAERFLWELRKHFITEKDIKRIKNLGFNCARLPFHYALLEERPFRYSKRGFAFSDTVLGWFEKYNVYAILDLHAAPGAQNPDWHSDSKGEALLWKKKGFQERTVNLWAAIADGYKEKSCIAGYDILNEPVTENKGLFQGLYRKIIKAIRASGSRQIIFQEGLLWAQDLSAVPAVADDNSALSIHTYQPIDFVFNFHKGLTYPGKVQGKMWNKGVLRRRLDKYARQARKQRLPIFVGEFGINARCHECRSGLRWLEDILSLFNEFNFHWTYWTYKTTPIGIFPDGLYQLLENYPWIQRDSPITGWERWGSFLKEEKEDLILKGLETENFTRWPALIHCLRKALS